MHTAPLNDVKAVCFDLDGTLLDTLEEIGSSANTVLARRGFPEHEIEAYRYFVGDGVRRLIERVLPEEHRSPAEVELLTNELEREYHRRANRMTKVYPGIPELLSELTSRNFPLAVLSNKPHNLSLECMEKFFPDHSFEIVQGQSKAFPKKPDPAGAQHVAEELDCRCAEILYVGDTNVDMETAKRSGMIGVGVLWGFRDRAELLQHGANFIAEVPNEILSLLPESRLDVR